MIENLLDNPIFVKHFEGKLGYKVQRIDIVEDGCTQWFSGEVFCVPSIDSPLTKEGIDADMAFMGKVLAQDVIESRTVIESLLDIVPFHYVNKSTFEPTLGFVIRGVKRSTNIGENIVALLRKHAEHDDRYINPNFVNHIMEAIHYYYPDLEVDDLHSWVMDLYEQ